MNKTLWILHHVMKLGETITLRDGINMYDLITSQLYSYLDLRAIARKPRPNAHDPAQSSFIGLTNFHIYDRGDCLMNFAANRIKIY